ncbi:MAG: regulatory protein RecX [Bacteroidota bacterium]
MASSQNISREEALSRAMRYCAYQERCRADVEKKLFEWNLTDADKQWVLKLLGKEKFLNDQRFALAFARAKLNQNHWGRNKIRYALMEKKIPQDDIQEALDNLPPEDYFSILQKAAADKARQTGMDSVEQKMKVKRFLQQRGFSFDEIGSIMKKLEKNGPSGESF